MPSSVLALSANGEIALWNTNTRQCTATIQLGDGCDRDVHSVLLSPDCSSVLPCCSSFSQEIEVHDECVWGLCQTMLVPGLAAQACPSLPRLILAVWAEATLGRAALRAAVWAALLVGAPRLAPNQRPRWRAALRAVLARLDDTEPGG